MDRQTFKIHNYKDVGEVHIADEVIAIIAGMAASDVEGVKGMVGSTTDDIVELLGRKNLSKGVSVDVTDGTIALGLSLVVNYGSSIVDVSNQVTEKVKGAVETMTGLEVAEVNINVAGVDFEK